MAESTSSHERNMRGWLRQHGAETIEHPGGNLYAHLSRVHDRLGRCPAGQQEWRRQQESPGHQQCVPVCPLLILDWLVGQGEGSSYLGAVSGAEVWAMSDTDAIVEHPATEAFRVTAVDVE
jgi:hypothetical protein